MLSINKLISSTVVDHAAEELKKYLRMMMPECGDIRISYNPLATDGFRLGLMQDLGLDVSDAADTELDDILYIDCDTEGGIIAGDNPRSVLLAVYEYLRQNGCRWLFPGVDGELIPMQDTVPVKYRHKPSMRYRGWCNEGAEYQECMMSAIDFMPKVGMNVMMLEFRVPTAYYERYYDHPQNPCYSPESLSERQIIQWKRQCEAELARRGIQFHDIGHGWTVEPFGILANCAWHAIDDSTVSDESRRHLAMFDGKRQLWRGQPMNTNFCMSNEESRRIFVNYVADYAESHSNIDYLHVWLSDGINNHCECNECNKKRPADWYMMLMNELDRELTRRALDTRIVFIVYTDTTWPPVTERIENPERFAILLAPITRSYAYTVRADHTPSIRPYVRNGLSFPDSLDEYLAYFAEWRKFWHGAAISYEYHFWHHQYKDLAGVGFSRRISEDIKEYERRGVVGIIEDGSQRSFFPTSLAFYTYARTLYDTSLTPEEIAKEYFEAAFGDGSGELYAFMADMSALFEFEYIEGAVSEDRSVSPYYAPKYAERLEKSTPALLQRGEKLVEKYYDSDYRTRTVSIRLIEHYLKFTDYYSRAVAAKARGNDLLATEIFTEWRERFGTIEHETRQYLDNFLFFRKLEGVLVTDRSKTLNATEI